MSKRRKPMRIAAPPIMPGPAFATAAKVLRQTRVHVPPAHDPDRMPSDEWKMLEMNADGIDLAVREMVAFVTAYEQWLAVALPLCSLFGRGQMKKSTSPWHPRGPRRRPGPANGVCHGVDIHAGRERVGPVGIPATEDLSFRQPRGTRPQEVDQARSEPKNKIPPAPKAKKTGAAQTMTVSRMLKKILENDPGRKRRSAGVESRNCRENGERWNAGGAGTKANVEAYPGKGARPPSASLSNAKWERDAARQDHPAPPCRVGEPADRSGFGCQVLNIGQEVIEKGMAGDDTIQADDFHRGRPVMPGTTWEIRSPNQVPPRDPTHRMILRLMEKITAIRRPNRNEASPWTDIQATSHRHGHGVR